MKPLILPYEGKVEFESPYGYRKLNGETVWHNGIDLVGLDSKLIISPCDGVVKTSTIVTDTNNKTWEWGNYVRIDYEDISVFLCHMSERFVSKGDIVSQGMLIGIEGNTGYSFGSHCHFEVRKNTSNIINPCELLGIPNHYGIYENYVDNDPVGHDWSEKEIQWAIENKILRGYSETEADYKLEQNITREEAIVLLYRLFKLIN